MDKIKFHCQISDGTYLLDQRERLLFIRHCKTLKNGDYYITINKQTQERSNQQLRYIWGVMYKMIAKHTGHTVDEVHEAMKEKFLWDWDVITTESGKEFSYKHDRSLSSEAGETTTMVIDYIQDVRNFWYEYDNLDIPEPDRAEA